MLTPTSIRYVAEPKQVREVSLIGTSDFGFWFDYLKPERLEPVRSGDAAQVMIVAAEMAYWGIRFTEVSFSVRAALAQNRSIEGMRLLHAFTTNRVFAWCERTFFKTPYTCAECQVSVQQPPLARARQKGQWVFKAEMSPLARTATRAGEETWQGPVFLPPHGAADEGRVFFGRLRGHTVAYPFSSDDRFTIEPSAGGGVLQPLADSRFCPQEWVVRADATHGKSKTYRRINAFAP